jgi:hypothetical protein
MGKHIKCFLGLAILLVLGACNTKKEKAQDIDGEVMLIGQYKNNAERINTANIKKNQFGTKSTGLFNGVNQRSTNFSFGGKYSLIANKDNPYAFDTRFKVEASSFIEVSIWRRKCSDCGILTIKHDKKLILNSTHIIIQETKHWEKLFVSETASDGFDADYCKGNVDSSVFANTGNDSIDFSTSKISMNNIKITNSGDKGVSGGEASILKMQCMV